MDEVSTKSGWDCKCGKKGNSFKFCPNCGEPRPEPVIQSSPSGGVGGNIGWICICGTENTSKFCRKCGKPRPVGSSFMLKCDKCGWEPEDPTNPPKFCPECGDVFDDNDIQK